MMYAEYGIDQGNELTTGVEFSIPISILQLVIYVKKA